MSNGLGNVISHLNTSLDTIKNCANTNGCRTSNPEYIYAKGLLEKCLDYLESFHRKTEDYKYVERGRMNIEE